MEAVALPGVKKKCSREKRTIVFLDESGLSERPHRVRTWAPKGETPVLQYHFNWHKLSVIAGITWREFYVQLHEGSIKAPQVIQFITHLCRHIRGRLLLLLDRLPAHRSRLVRDFVAATRGRIELEFLPAYAPELNPTEYIWAHLKTHELPNYCPKTLWDLGATARRALRRMRRRPSLICAFWKQADLFM